MLPLEESCVQAMLKVELVAVGRSLRIGNSQYGNDYRSVLFHRTLLAAGDRSHSLYALAYLGPWLLEVCAVRRIMGHKGKRDLELRVRLFGWRCSKMTNAGCSPRWSLFGRPIVRGLSESIEYQGSFYTVEASSLEPNFRL